MSIVITLFLGFLACSLAVPVDQPTPYDPQDFFPSSQRIVGGSDAPDGVAQHMVALLVGDVLAMLVCGGSLVAPDKVLTAAHCIEAMWSFFPFPQSLSGPGSPPLLPSARAVLGTNKWSDERRIARFSGYLIHPNYDRFRIKYDAGFVMMTEKVKLDDRVKLIALNYNWVGGGVKSCVTGWGTIWAWGPIPDILQYLCVYTLSPKQCEDAMRRAEAEMGSIPPMSSSVEICTMHERGAGKGMCHGDSGSALVDPLLRQIGIVSWGMPCALGHPDMFARISGFIEFLDSVLNPKLE